MDELGYKRGIPKQSALEPDSWRDKLIVFSKEARLRNLLLIVPMSTGLSPLHISLTNLLKKWRREKKEKLINELNPEWKDLWKEIREW